jgi:iron-sulfur cluster insertion protein
MSSSLPLFFALATGRRVDVAVQMVTMPATPLEDRMSETIALTPFVAPAPIQQPPAAAPEGFTGESVALMEFPLTFTARALEMVRAALAETGAEDGEFLRVGVKGGGCSGFQYSLNFTDETDEEDILVMIDGTKIVTDAFSREYLKGTELDYVETLQGAGFKFVNPNAKRTCGCGSSFSA